MRLAARLNCPANQGLAMPCNAPRATDYMRRYGLDAIIATAPVNITYFTGYYCWLDGQFKEFMVSPGGGGDLLPAFALYPLQGRPGLTVSALIAVNALGLPVDLCPWGDGRFEWGKAADTDLEQQDLLAQLRDCEAATAVEALALLVRRKGLAHGRLGLEMEGMPPALLAAVKAALPGAQLVDCSNMIRLIRMVKSPGEIALMEGAARIGEQAAAAALMQARPGVRLRDMQQRFGAQVGLLGAEVDHFAYGIRGLGLGTEPDYSLVEGDALYIDYGCLYRNYCSDSGLTLALGGLDDEWAGKYRALYECMQAGRAVLQVGQKASDAPQAMWAVLAGHGIAASFPHGHGVGLEVRDYPILVEANGRRIVDDCVDEAADLPLEADMVLNLEAMIFAPGRASVHIEQSFVVEEGGNRPLVAQDREQPVIPG
ncbi:MAG: M24 family metallopeptidase [Candidatus Latescibacteria bacterium]|nr:M24 family metallopeptidase [Candidatus Latescibacterota bacterium]